MVVRRLLLAVVLFLAVLVVAADRVGAIVGAHVLASKIETDAGLAGRPNVSIGGFPFLTQAAGGTYSDIAVTDTDVPVAGVDVTKLTVNLHGVHVRMGSLVKGDVSQVPVDRANGTAFVSFTDANNYLVGRHIPIRLEPGKNGTVRLVETILGIPVSETATATVDGDAVVATVSNLSGPLGILNHAVSVRLPLQGLPFQMALSSVKIGPTGITAVGSAHRIVLGRA
jgi:LmeA-like phospholipid-binding